jgi:hypothetical protein
MGEENYGLMGIWFKRDLTVIPFTCPAVASKFFKQYSTF